MRISSETREALIAAIDRARPSQKASELYFFDSRVDNAKRGGDIDLLWVLSPDDLEILRASLVELRSRLREAAGDQKVDLSLATDEKLSSDPFLRSL